MSYPNSILNPFLYHVFMVSPIVLYVWYTFQDFHLSCSVFHEKRKKIYTQVGDLKNSFCISTRMKDKLGKIQGEAIRERLPWASCRVCKLAMSSAQLANLRILRAFLFFRSNSWKIFDSFPFYKVALLRSSWNTIKGHLFRLDLKKFVLSFSWVNMNVEVQSQMTHRQHANCSTVRSVPKWLFSEGKTERENLIFPTGNVNFYRFTNIFEIDKQKDGQNSWQNC